MFLKRSIIFIIIPYLIAKLTMITAQDENENDINSDALRQMQNRRGHHHHPENEDVTDDHEMLGEEHPPGDPFGGKHTLNIGDRCIQSNARACKYYPEVTCVWVEETDFVCRCDFQHSWDNTSKLCIPNVFTPCLGSKSNNTGVDNDCGVNMECIPDLIGSNPNEKLCRCKNGFKVKMDEEGLPSKCVVDKNYADEELIIFITSYGSSVTAMKFPTVIFIVCLHNAFGGFHF